MPRERSIGAMASYRSDAILTELLRFRRELWENLARTRQQRRRRAYERDVDPDDVAAAVYFVKRLARKAGDVQLLGHAELASMEMDEAPPYRYEEVWQPDEATRAAMERKPAIAEPHAYSSNDFIVVLSQLVAGDAQRRYWRGFDLSDDWLVQAALFAKRLATEARDGDLLVAVEMTILDAERIDQERLVEARREDDQQRLECEEEEDRKWDAYEYVGTTQLGRKLNPPLEWRDVNKLLAEAGLMTRNDANEWVFTAAGAEFGRPEVAKEGVQVHWPAWSKTVLPVLQSTLDRSRDAEPATSPEASKES